MGRRRVSKRASAIATTVAVAGAFGVLTLRLWVVEPVTVSSTSMEPTFERGQTVVLSRLAPAAGEDLVGRVVGLRDPQDGGITLKRVAAAAGQSLAIRDGVLYVDEAAVDEPYLDPRQNDGLFFHRVTVPAGHVFVLGDNRPDSVDSRDFGFVPLEDLTATVLWSY
jgi:signal peptidase I